MKKTITTIGMAMLMSITAIVFNGCKGKDGAPGATGPAGAQGNANVLVSTGTTTNASWSFNSTYNEWDAIFNDSDISSAVVSTGTMQVFIGDGTGTNWSAMPLSYQGTEFNYTYGVGQVQLQVTLSSGTAPTNPGGLQFKFVVIPSRSLIANPNVNIKDYTSLQKVFNIK